MHSYVHDIVITITIFTPDLLKIKFFLNRIKYLLMSKSILGIIIAMFASLLVRAEQPIFNISSTDANPAQIIDIDFNVDNFSDLIAVQYSVNWNPDVSDYQKYEHLSSGFEFISLWNTTGVFGCREIYLGLD